MVKQEQMDYKTLALVALGGLALYFYFKQREEPPPAPPVNGDGDGELYTYRKGLYDNLKDRGGLKWETAAEEFWAASEDAATRDDIYAIYQAVYKKYVGVVTHKCPACGAEFFTAEELHQHYISAHGLPTISQINAVNNLNEIKKLKTLIAQLKLFCPESEWRLPYLAALRRWLYLEFATKTNPIWHQAAAEFWAETYEGMTYPQLSAKYSEIYDRYIAKPTPPYEPPTGLLIQEQLVSIMPYLTIVWVLRQGEWLFFDPKDPGSDLLQIYQGEGASVQVTQACTLTYNGYTNQLKAGWNNIGWQAGAVLQQPAAWGYHCIPILNSAPRAQYGRMGGRL